MIVASMDVSFCTLYLINIFLAEGSKKTCKACRFKTCVEVGMIIDSVWRRRLLEEGGQFHESTILQRMLKARQATFVNKVNLMSKLSVKMNVSYFWTRVGLHSQFLGQNGNGHS
jgi:hypothetical protein